MCQVRSQNINTRYTFMHSAPKKVHIVNEKCKRAAQKSAENPLSRRQSLLAERGFTFKLFQREAVLDLRWCPEPGSIR